MAPTPATTVKSATRVIEVLEYFRDHREPHSLKQLTQALGYPQSSTTVLLKSLVTLGYINYDRVHRVYFPTLRVASLGDWISQALLGQGRLLEAMRDVFNGTGETVSIAVQNDVYMQYIRVIQSSHALRFYTEEGSMRPLVQSSLGWLLMSTRPDEEVERLVRRANIAIPRPGDRVKVNEMVERIAALRGQPTVYAENTPLLGGATLCTLLPVTIHDQPVAFGLGGALERVRPLRQRYAALLRRAALSVPQRHPPAAAATDS
jgi:IclR family KDG regulon transcriptional repressor